MNIIKYKRNVFRLSLRCYLNGSYLNFDEDYVIDELNDSNVDDITSYFKDIVNTFNNTRAKGEYKRTIRKIEVEIIYKVKHKIKCRFINIKHLHYNKDNYKF